MTKKPLIGIVTCSLDLDYGLFYMTGEKYITAIHDYADAVPLLIPSLGDDLDLQAVFAKLDGILFTGSPSNVHPDRYGGPPQREGKKDDTRRDATVFPILQKALDVGKPILCICRGHQELNVALGGTLHQHVHEVEGYDDHRELQDASLQESYRSRQTITLTEGGHLQKLNGGNTQARVNTLHWQGIDRLGDGLFVEATAEDGLIEACTLPSAKGYVLSVQWHPEHPFALEEPLNRAIFQDFHHATA